MPNKIIKKIIIKESIKTKILNTKKIQHLQKIKANQQMKKLQLLKNPFFQVKRN